MKAAKDRPEQAVNDAINELDLAKTIGDGSSDMLVYFASLQNGNDSLANEAKKRLEKQGFTVT